jgi:hypothetical protein
VQRLQTGLIHLPAFLLMTQQRLWCIKVSLLTKV